MDFDMFTWKRCRNSPDSFAMLAHQSGLLPVPELLHGL